MYKRSSRCQKGRAWIELDMENLGHNVEQFKRLLPGTCTLMPAIKANAYGHGAVRDGDPGLLCGFCL